MKANDQYITIVREIEHKLYRKLTVKELNFVNWMVKKDQFNMKDFKDASNKVINLEQWYRKKYHTPFS